VNGVLARTKIQNTKAGNASIIHCRDSGRNLSTRGARRIVDRKGGRKKAKEKGGVGGGDRRSLGPRRFRVQSRKASKRRGGRGGKATVQVIAIKKCVHTDRLKSWGEKRKKGK